jgi:hypothetical protein
MPVPTKAERDANLDALQSAVEEWATKEKTRIEEEIAFLRKVLKGRTGAEEANSTNLAASLELVTAEIDSFIIGA